MPQRIFITGYGIISCIGSNIEETLTSLLGSKSGTGSIRHIETILKDELLVGEVPFTHEELFKMAGITPAEGFTRNALLGIIAAKEAFSHSHLERHTELKTGLISATTVGGMDRCELYYDDFLTNDTRNAYIDSYDCADSTERIAKILGIRDFVTTISTACSSAANSIMLAARMIRAGKLDRAVAGGCESLTRFHLNGFNALKILDKDPCKPFDQNRAGINLGEGAAYVVLESEESVTLSGNTPLCELVGWGNSCEAFHQTASSPDGKGAFLAMQKALNMSGMQAEQIDYVNAHGTGTDNNDLSEGRAIEQLFGERLPKVSSTKPFTGHTTSAAGSTEAILSIFCLQHQVIWPNLNFGQRIEELSFSPVEKLIRDMPVNAVMSNSFGFGGNDTSLIFKKVEGDNFTAASTTEYTEKASRAYINGIGMISPQRTAETTDFLPEIVEHQADYLKCIEPVYRTYIDPIQSRRMSRLIKMGIAAAKMSAAEAGCTAPDAIITGTGLGSVEDTEKILGELTKEEKFLNPTPFIQSTYNTISSQVAIQLKCHEYNSTYVHRTFSFESGLTDGLQQIEEKMARNILVGAIDEMTMNHLQITRRIGQWKREPVNNLTIRDLNTPGALPGEGAAFFVIGTEKQDSTYAELVDVATGFKLDEHFMPQTFIGNFLEKNGLRYDQVDVVLLGLNGDADFDPEYLKVAGELFPQQAHGWYKHLCGEYHTATGFGLYLAANILKRQDYPEILHLNKVHPGKIKNILIYNHFRNINHTLILVSQV